LQDQQPNYRVSMWEEDEQKRKRLLKNICEYPYLIDMPGAAQSAGQIGTSQLTLMNSSI